MKYLRSSNLLPPPNHPPFPLFQKSKTWEPMMKSYGISSLTLPSHFDRFLERLSLVEPAGLNYGCDVMMYCRFLLLFPVLSRPFYRSLQLNLWLGGSAGGCGVFSFRSDPACSISCKESAANQLLISSARVCEQGLVCKI